MALHPLKTWAAGAALALGACSGPAAPPAPAAPTIGRLPPPDVPPLEAAVERVQARALPLVLSAVDMAASALPEPPEAVGGPAPWVAEATDCLLRWEVGGRGRYERLYQGVIWPGGASGPTWGLGYDGGHNTRAEINRAWSIHPQVDRLEDTSGVTGPSARQRVRAGEWAGVLTPFPMAETVFQTHSLPEYGARARRVMGAEVFDRLKPEAQGVWVCTVYNRGGSLVGDARREMRTIAQTCAPAADYACMAAEYRSMCRLWRGRDVGPGLCARYEDMARRVE